MKKNVLIIFFSFLFLFVNAQIPIITGNHLSFENIHGNDSVNVIVFDSINANTKIEFVGNSVEWYKFDNLSTPVSSFNELYNPDDATGYRVAVDGKYVNLWILNYQNYLSEFSSFDIDLTTDNQCDELKLNLAGTIPALTYNTLSGGTYSLSREFKIEYTTLNWTESWSQKDTTINVILPMTEISVPSPLCNTTFKISGDQYATDLGLIPAEIVSPEYSAIAVECHPTSITTIRTEKNEAERPSQATAIDGSAPLDIEFLSNANEPVAKFYKWEVFKNNVLLINRNDKDHRYTFTESGNYTVKVTASNSSCSYIDSINVTVSESDLQVPNVFTPNDDGFNDEFRVGFKSIVKFDCWVYNRWGRMVFHWSDPTKGWDGKINGKNASAGPYFYIIKAYGSDYDPESERNKITKLRVGEYIMRGDINLLRGKE